MRHWLRLIRTWNVLLSGAAALVGAFIATGRFEQAIWLIIPIAPMLITAAGNIQNDLCDRAIDRLNRPDRPLASGAIQPASAKLAVIILFAIGVLATLPLGSIPVVITLLVVLLLTLYNTSWSRLPGLGNLAVSLMGALPIVFGATAIAQTNNSRSAIAVAAAAVAFWMHLARELTKDVSDIEGDRAGGRRTLPIVWGHATVMRATALVMLTAAATSLWLGTTGWLGPIYMIGICLTVLPALLYGAAQCFWRPEPAIATFWSGGLKLIMLAGLIWVALAAPGQ
ncbi:MAG: geranylgeranylglycerol-phosphate geranylgeranyltransferase [candidate division Zixibacteria bacterium]|nr:geranylgeranylglycerol-phosphate geranylgeranyltransferase [candidate division Zixibacteria bacterium]